MTYLYARPRPRARLLPSVLAVVLLAGCAPPRVGGTGQALRIAHHHVIQVFNLDRPEHAERVSRHCAREAR
jgi:hypothetical protein